MSPLRRTTLALAATLLSVSSVHAGLILGWSSFSAATGNTASPVPLAPNADGTGGLLSGHIDLLSETSSTSTGGAGNSSWGSLVSPPAPGNNNGYINLRSGNRVNLYLSNPGPTSISVALSDIHLDNAKVTSGSGTLSLWWEQGTPTEILSIPRTIDNASYFNADLVTSSPASQSFFLSPGEARLVLSFRAANKVFRLDNIRLDGTVSAFSAIPEVSSALVLGGLLGSGLLIRRRPGKAIRA